MKPVAAKPLWSRYAVAALRFSLLCCLTMPAFAETKPIAKPNIAIIFIDDLRKALDQFKDARPPALTKPATMTSEKEDQ